MRSQTTYSNVFSSKDIDVIVERVNEVDINIKIKNNSNEPLRFSSPQCWVNSIIELYSETGEFFSQGIKIKPDFKCAHYFVSLKPGQEFSVPFGYSLEKLYPNVKPGTYNFQYIYTGKVKNLNGQFIIIKDPLKSNKLSVNL